MKDKIILFCLVILTGMINLQAKESLSLAVASNFTRPMNELVALFEKQTGNKVRLSSGSSGKLYAQIRHGAPYQIFFSADQSKALALEKSGFIVPGSRATYVEGVLALWAKEPLPDFGQKTLERKAFRKLAIANPRLAPYGQAAKETLIKLELLESLKNNLVYGENIAQTYQFVASGNAQLGLVALSQIYYRGKIERGSAWVVPFEFYSPLKQDRVVLKSAANNPLVDEFLAFLDSADAKKIIRHYGYQLP